MVLEVLALVMKTSENNHVYRYCKEWTENPELRIRTHVVFSMNLSALKNAEINETKGTSFLLYH